MPQMQNRREAGSAVATQTPGLAPIHSNALEGCDFLGGGGAMGEAIRAFDWRTTSLGHPAGWPQSLRTVVRLMLSTNHPMFIFWGPQHICLYNDAYSRSIGPEKHPAMLGSRAAESWHEIWPVIGPQIELVMRGDGVTWHENSLVPITRHGRLEDVYWTYGYSPIDDDAAANGVGGVLVLCTETTAQVLADRRQSFLITLTDRLLATQDPHEAMDAVCESLGRYLSADAVGFAYYDEDWAAATVEQLWRGPSMGELAGRYETAAFGPLITAELRAGRAVLIDDVLRSPLVTGSTAKAGFAAINTRAMLQLPLSRSNKVGAAMFIMSIQPRDWTEHEIKLAEQVAVRAAAAVERARGDRALRDSEALLRAIGESTAELIYAKDREHRMVYANPATLKAIGRSAAEVIGRNEQQWHHNVDEAAAIIAADEQVMVNGETRRLEERLTPPRGTERLYTSIKAPMHNDAREVVGIVGVSSDITERHRDQLHLNLLVAELNHRVKNTLAIVQSLAHQTFRGAGIPENAKKAFEGRLVALATAHNLLTRERWQATDLEAVVVETLSAQVGDPTSVSIHGPQVQLDPATAVSIAMALHELTTNAIKYGALSADGGHVRVNWSIEGEERPRLHLKWSESGGPQVVVPERRGFGSRMIERALASELRGKVLLDFRPEGLCCTIDAPLPKVVTPSLEP